MKMSETNECYALYPKEYYDIRQHKYVMPTEPQAYDYNDYSSMFAACCGAHFDDATDGPFDDPDQFGIIVAARTIPDLDLPERVVDYIQTKNGPLTIVTATSWNDYEPPEEENW
jgi:hypothetical protein